MIGCNPLLLSNGPELALHRHDTENKKHAHSSYPAVQEQ